MRHVIYSIYFKLKTRWLQISKKAEVIEKTEVLKQEMKEFQDNRGRRLPLEELKHPYRKRGRNHSIFIHEDLWNDVDRLNRGLVSHPPKNVIVQYCLAYEVSLAQIIKEIEAANEEQLLKIKQKWMEEFEKYAKQISNE